MWELFVLASAAAASPLPPRIVAGQDADCRTRIVLSSNTAQPQRRPTIGELPARPRGGQRPASRPCGIPA